MRATSIGAVIGFFMSRDDTFSSAFTPSLFAVTSRTRRTSTLGQLHVFSRDNDMAFSDNREDRDDFFMTSLQSRMTQLKKNEDTLPLIRMDSILPRQVRGIVYCYNAERFELFISCG